MYMVLPTKPYGNSGLLVNAALQTGLSTHPTGPLKMYFSITQWCWHGSFWFRVWPIDPPIGMKIKTKFQMSGHQVDAFALTTDLSHWVEMTFNHGYSLSHWLWKSWLATTWSAKLCSPISPHQSAMAVYLAAMLCKCPSADAYLQKLHYSQTFPATLTICDGFQLLPFKCCEPLSCTFQFFVLVARNWNRNRNLEFCQNSSGILIPDILVCFFRGHNWKSFFDVNQNLIFRL